MGTPISALRFDDLFVRSLPGDPSRDARPRQVTGACYSFVEPTHMPAPKLMVLVPETAELLGLDPIVTSELVDVLSGAKHPPRMRPYAACYGGHQFGVWAGQLGDGRAITLGEVLSEHGRFELQLKGAGQTPYSRGGDGRAVLRSSIRELVASEAMFHLRVPSTRALSLVLTGEDVLRDLLYDGNAAHEPGAILCRVAPTFLRFGSFEIHASRGDKETLRRLAAHTIATWFPEHGALSHESVAAMFETIAERTARMIVEWLRVGFVHGVMNSDNMSILGLTIDYGPYGFLDAFELDWTPNTTDAGTKRYRFSHQARVARWNLAQLAHALTPLVRGVAAFDSALARYDSVLESGTRAMMLAKLGLSKSQHDADHDLLNGLFELLDTVETDMTLFYRTLAELPLDRALKLEDLGEALYRPVAELSTKDRAMVEAWLARWSARTKSEGRDDAERRRAMNETNPLYVPRNYLAQEVIDAATAGDFTHLERWLEVLRRPYEHQVGAQRFAAKRPDWAKHKPGSSMLSCSS